MGSSVILAGSFTAVGVGWLWAGLGQSPRDGSALTCAVSLPPAACLGLSVWCWQGCERQQRHPRALETWAQNRHSVTSVGRSKLEVTPDSGIGEI